MKLVSIIVPIYNIELFLQKCIDSIRTQTYENIEIILVDDGSQDNSIQICKKNRMLDKRIQIVHQENAGLSAARNKGLALAKGEYIFFVDGDDWIETDTIRQLLLLAEQYHSDIVTCGINEIYQDGEVKSSKERDIVNLTNIEAIEMLLKQGDLIGTVVWNKLYRNKLFKKLNFEVGKIHEDVFFTPKALYFSEKVTITQVPLYNYVIKRAGSITGNKLSLRNLDALEAYKSNALFFYDKNLKKFNNTYLLKYYGAVLDLYCKFRRQGEHTFCHMVEVKFTGKYFYTVYISLKQKDLKQIVKFTIFKLSHNFYYYIWRRYD